MFDAEEQWNELVSCWPKKQGELYWARDRVAFDKKVKSEEDYEKLKNQVECILEDTPVTKLPNLCDIINSLFKVNKKPVEIDNKPVALDQEELYKKTNDPEISKVFTKIWEVWPRSPDFVERRSNALDAFLAAARVLPLPDIETACITYANAFSDGSSSMVYPRSLKRFVSDHSYMQEWIDKNNNSKLYETEKKQFEVAYSWYPVFVGKDGKKTKDASWVVYWRSVQYAEKLDFLSVVKLYRRQRKAEVISRDLSEDEGVSYTKSFINFVNDWKQVFTGNRVLEAKADIFAYQTIAFAREAGLDLNNIWGEDSEPVFVRVLTYLCGTMPNIHAAIKEGLVRTVKLVEDVKNNPSVYNNIRDKAKALGEIPLVNVETLSESLYKRVFELKVYEMPPDSGVLSK